MKSIEISPKPYDTRMNSKTVKLKLAHVWLRFSMFSPYPNITYIGGRMDGETPSGQSRGGSPAWCACQIHNLLLMLPHITRYMLQIRLTDLNWRHLAQTSWHLCFFSSSYISIPETGHVRLISVVLRGHPDFFQKHHSFARAFSAAKNPGASTFPAIIYYYNIVLYNI